MQIEIYTASLPLELRESGERFEGVILQEGRAGSSRAELFTPGSLIWGDSGIAIRTEHRGREVARAIPSRHPGGTIRISAKATPEIREAFNAGRRFLSVEFQALAETRTAARIREISRAYVEAAAMTVFPEYTQARAELRQRDRRRVWM